MDTRTLSILTLAVMAAALLSGCGDKTAAAPEPARAGMTINQGSAPAEADPIAAAPATPVKPEAVVTEDIPGQAEAVLKDGVKPADVQSRNKQVLGFGALEGGRYMFFFDPATDAAAALASLKGDRGVAEARSSTRVVLDEKASKAAAEAGDKDPESAGDEITGSVGDVGVGGTSEAIGNN